MMARAAHRMASKTSSRCKKSSAGPCAPAEGANQSTTPVGRNWRIAHSKGPGSDLDAFAATEAEEEAEGARVSVEVPLPSPPPVRETSFVVAVAAVLVVVAVAVHSSSQYALA